MDLITDKLPDGAASCLDKATPEKVQFRAYLSDLRSSRDIPR